MSRAVVSVICLCYNHKHFLREAIESVLAQTYPAIEIIIVDDASTDGSQQQILELKKNYPAIQILLLPKNLGNCSAFNRGLALATGDFIIDFATDDVMLPDRVEEQIKFFKNQDEGVGVVFTDASYIDDSGVAIRDHYDYLFKKKLIDRIPTGDVFKNVLTTYFISAPTMMIRRRVMNDLGGYDETLAYEDFDFWVRASRNFGFEYLDRKTTKVRVTLGSMSSGYYKAGDRKLYSTFLVCRKAKELCRDDKDLDALRWRVLYEFKQATFSGNRVEAKLFSELLNNIGKVPVSFFIIKIVSSIPLPWRWIREKYNLLRYG